jgi:cytoskeletal protein CcmA (bactofilin family)
MSAHARAEFRVTDSSRGRPDRVVPFFNSERKGIPMLDNFRRRDVPRPNSLRSPSPYGQLQEALNSVPPHTEPSRPETPKPEPHDGSKAPRAGEEAVSKLIVGPDIKLKGAEITDCDTLVVEGRVEASMDSRVIQIAEHGVFVGKVGIDVAEIRGRFEGELTARKQLVIRSTGHVSGKIRYGKVAIEEGGELSGDIAAIAATKASGMPPAAVTDQERKPGVSGFPAPHPPGQPGALLNRPTGAPR